jgi:uncharacterized protein
MTVEQTNVVGFPLFPEPLPANAPTAFHLLTKPTGAICNLDCSYCYFLSKEMLYTGSRFRMADELLEVYIRQLIESHRSREITVAWQGGEPTLMGLEFFRRSIDHVEKYRKPGMTVQYSIQTNGTKLDGEWCEFFREHKFLVGLSIDGPQELHNTYRVDKGGNGTFRQVMRGLNFLKKHRVEFNILTTVHAENADHPLEVYRFLRDEVGTQFIQFIAIVERENDTGYQQGNTVTDRSVTAEGYGRFLSTIYDEWVRWDVGRVFVQLFDIALVAQVGAPPSVCVFSPTCGNALALEHTGDVYSCDHYVEPDFLLGNIGEQHLIELVASDMQRKFGLDKLDTLPRYCTECEVRFVCHGGCPKNRFILTPDGEPGLNYLCAGYRSFFNHIDQSMLAMANLLRQGQPPAKIMDIVASGDGEGKDRFEGVRRNDYCPCGSGRKFKLCHGRAVKSYSDEY